MNVFSKDDFKKDGVSFLAFDDSFEFDDTNKIIFGFNGIGKTSIYNYLKNVHKNDCYFLDYENKPNFAGRNKKVTISIDLLELNSLISEKDDILSKISIKNWFKNFGISKKEDVKKLNNERFNEIFYSDKTFAIESIEKEEFVNFISYFQKEEVINLIKNIDDIKKIYDLSAEISVDYSEKYLLSIFDILDKNYDHKSKDCPVCGTKNVDLFNYIEKKKKELLSLSTNVFGDFKYITSRKDDDRVLALNKLISVAKDISVEKIVTICLSNFSYDDYLGLKANYEKLSLLEKKISDIEVQRTNFYNAMSENEEFIKKNFEQIYINSEIQFDSLNKEIKIDLPREYKTYSTGELNELCLIIRLLSFKGSEKKLLIIDDPLSSYDFVNQYRIIFRIVKIANNEKTVIVFSHNIDTINIINTQHHGKFKYYYMEKYNSKLILEEIKSDSIKNSVLSLESIRSKNPYIDLLIYRDNSDEGVLFNGHKVFHYDSKFTFSSTNKNELLFNGLNNEYFINLIEDEKICYKKSFEENTVTKILYICGIRVWIEKKIMDFIMTLSCPEKNSIYDSFKSCNTTLKKINVVQVIPHFKDAFKNFSKESFMIKKVMLNQGLHYKSQIIPFNFAMNISLDDLIREISEIKEIFTHTS